MEAEQRDLAENRESSLRFQEAMRIWRRQILPTITEIGGLNVGFARLVQ